MERSTDSRSPGGASNLELRLDTVRLMNASALQRCPAFRAHELERWGTLQTLAQDPTPAAVFLSSQQPTQSWLTLTQQTGLRHLLCAGTVLT